MTSRRLITILTTTSVVASLLVAPASAQVKAPANKPNVPIVHEIVSTDSGKECAFKINPDYSNSTYLLSIDSIYLDARTSTLKAIRADFPQLADKFAEADKLTGTLTAPTGDVNSPELAAIVAEVSAAMVEAGYQEDEVYLAFYNTPAGNTATSTISLTDLKLLPNLTKDDAEAISRLAPEESNSILSRVTRYFTATAAARQWGYALQENGSLMLLSKLDGAKFNELENATKQVTARTPKSIEAIARVALASCITEVRSKNVMDGTTSSETSSDPLKGTSSDPNRPQKGGFTDGSAELSSGEGTSSKEELSSLSSTEGFSLTSSNNSPEANKKLALVIALVTMLGFVTNMLVTASGVLNNFNKMLEDEIARLKAEKAAKEAAEQAA